MMDAVIEDRLELEMWFAKRKEFEESLTAYASEEVVIDDFSICEPLFPVFVDEFMKFVAEDKRDVIFAELSKYQDEFQTYWQNNRPLEARVKRIINTLYKQDGAAFLRPVNDIRSHLLNIINKMVVRDGYFVFYFVDSFNFDYLYVDFGNSDVTSCFRNLRRADLETLIDLGADYLGIIQKDKYGNPIRAGRCWFIYFNNGISVAFNPYGDFYSVYEVMYPIARMVEKKFEIQTRMRVLPKGDFFGVYLNSDKILLIYDINKYSTSDEAYEILQGVRLCK